MISPCIAFNDVPLHVWSNRFIKEQHKVSRYICIKEMLSKWFWDTPFEDIPRGNVSDLLTYGFWYKSRYVRTAGTPACNTSMQRLQMLHPTRVMPRITLHDGH